MASSSSSTFLLSIPPSSLHHRSRHGRTTLPTIRPDGSRVAKFPNSIFVGGKPNPNYGFLPNPVLNSFAGVCHAGSSIGNADGDDPPLVGEDSAAFDLAKQKISSWVYFAGILGTVLFVLDVAWLDNSTGYGKAFIDAVSGLSDSHEVSK